MCAFTVDGSSYQPSSAREVKNIIRGLPSLAYTSETFWEQEKQSLFPNSWIFSGFCHEIPTAGDVMPVTVGSSPMLLVRDRDGRIRAFHNVCSHRVIKLVESPRNVGRLIKCPYHAWAYSLDGKLRATPYFGGQEPQCIPDGFERDCHGLHEVKCEVWFDWIFLNVDGNAQPFSEFIAPLKRRLDGIDFDQVVLAAVIDLGVVDANWKFLMENFIEPYHVQFVHSRTTAQPLVDHYTICDGCCMGSAVDLHASRNHSADNGEALAVSARFLSLFPTFALGRYLPNQIGVYLHSPLGPERTRQRRAIYMTDGTVLSDTEMSRLKTLWTRVHREDHEMCIRLQQGRESDVANGGGLLSPYWEDSVHMFQTMVMDAVSSENE